MELFIEFYNNGYCMHILSHYDPYTGMLKKQRYMLYSEREAIKKHRKTFGLEYKHLTKIYL